MHIPFRMAVMALAAVAPVGCGTSEEEQARQVAQRFESAMSRGDAREACSLMTPASRRDLVVTVANDPAVRPGPKRTITSCVRAVPGFAGGEAGIAGEVELGDGTATVSVRSPSHDPDGGGSIGLVRQHGEWRVGTTY